MKKLITLVWLCLMVCGCEYAVDEYINEHTSFVSTTTNDEYSVDIMLENEDDLAKSEATPDDLLLAQQIIYEETGVTSLKSVTVYMPHDTKAWRDLHVESGQYMFCDDINAPSCGWHSIAAEHTRGTDLDTFIVLMNPDTWYNKSKNDIIQVYLHELVHDVVEEETGDPDGDHENSEYWWDKGGLLRLLVSRWLELTLE